MSAPGNSADRLYHPETHAVKAHPRAKIRFSSPDTSSGHPKIPVNGGVRMVAMAFANKLARIARAVLAYGRGFEADHCATA
jgi:hypothetical protein